MLRTVLLTSAIAFGIAFGNPQSSQAQCEKNESTDIYVEGSLPYEFIDARLRKNLTLTGAYLDSLSTQFSSHSKAMTEYVVITQDVLPGVIAHFAVSWTLEVGQETVPVSALDAKLISLKMAGPFFKEVLDFLQNKILPSLRDQTVSIISELSVDEGKIQRKRAMARLGDSTNAVKMWSEFCLNETRIVAYSGNLLQGGAEVVSQLIPTKSGSLGDMTAVSVTHKFRKSDSQSPGVFHFAFSNASKAAGGYPEFIVTKSSGEVLYRTGILYPSNPEATQFIRMIYGLADTLTVKLVYHRNGEIMDSGEFSFEVPKYGRLMVTAQAKPLTASLISDPQ